MATLRRTIRLFVSSTFADMKAERDVLQSDVFPKLRQLCLSNGLRFQAIDLRWGVPEEAGNDNSTMRICLRELKRCQEGRPRPNFLVLLGDRYGWQPLPEIIPADLFVQLRDLLPTKMQELFEWRDTQPANAKGWYRRDNNAVPSVYELRPRGDDEKWHETVEQPLLHALKAVAHDIGLDAEAHGIAIGTSATEQEIVEGALRVDDAQDHVHAFFRSISGLPQDSWPKELVDVSPDGTRDSGAVARLDDLKIRIEAKVGATNVHRYTVPWHEGGVQPVDLTQFGKDVYAALSQVVMRQMEKLTSTSREVQEEEAHRTFGDERRHGFIGRTEPLERIAACLREGDSRMMAVVGPAGSGKSAVMAEAVRRARATYGEDAVLARFIGATPDSANLLSLLGNLVREIRRHYPAPPPKEGEQSKDGEIPVEINPLTVAFHEALSRPTTERPLFIFLDALNQLGPGNGALECYWLPSARVRNVRLIVSAALPATAHAISGGNVPEPALLEQDPRAVVVAALERRASDVQQIRLGPLPVAEGRALVAAWLGDARRTLQPEQQEAILKSFAREGSPLWLRVAIGESQRLTAWDAAPDFDPSLQGLLRQVLDHLSEENEHGAVLVKRALASIASARHGLAEDEMMDVLSADQKVMAEFRRRSPKSPERDTLPVAVWVRLHGDIAEYLAEHQQQNATLLGFYHRSFLEAVQAAYLCTRETQRAAHQRLAEYFGHRSWFIPPAAEEGLAPRAATLSDPPDARKTSELPWHLLRVADVSDPTRELVAVWDPSVEVLCDMMFVESKCRAGLVFELQEDYREAKKALPDAQAILREEKQRKAEADRWTKEIIAYSQAWCERRDRLARGEQVDESEPVLPNPPKVCPMRKDQESEADLQRIREEPTRFERLVAFVRFVGSECHHLVQFGGREGFTFQQAINYAPGGPVHVAARQLLLQSGAPLLLRRWPGDAVWNPKPGLIRTLEGHGGGVLTVSVTADGRRAVSGSRDKTLRVWDLERGICIRRLDGDDAVTSISITPDGRRAVSGNFGEPLMKVWDLETGACTRTIEGGRGWFWSVSITPDGRCGVSGSNDFSNSDSVVRMWDLESGVCLQTLEGHKGHVECVSVTPDGQRAVSGGDEGIRVWDLQRAACLRLLKDFSGAASVTVTQDGRRALASNFLYACVWDLQEGASLQILQGDYKNVEGVSITPGGERAISGTGTAREKDYCDPTLRVWDVDKGTCLLALDGLDGNTRTLSMTPDGRLAVSGSEDNTLQIWDLENGACSRKLEGHKSVVTSVTMTSDGRRAVSASGYDVLRVWDLERGICIRRLKGDADVRSVSITPDGRHFVSGGTNKLRVWDLESGTCLRTLENVHLAWYSNVCVTPDGRRAVGSEHFCLFVLDLETGARLHSLTWNTSIISNSVTSISLTPDGQQAVSAGYMDETLRVWDLERGVCLRTLEGHSDHVRGVSVTPDGRRAVSGSKDKTLKVWDLTNGACLRTLEGHEEGITCVSALAPWGETNS